MCLLPLCEAKEKHCPLTNQTYKGDMCMAWRWAELVEMEATARSMTAAGFMPGGTAAKPAPATAEAVTAPMANAPCCNRRRLADVPPGRKRHKAGEHDRAGVRVKE